MKNPIIAMSLIAIAAATFGCASSGTVANQTAATPTGRVNPDLITTAEIEAVNARDAYELVQRLRPNWISRGTAGSSNMGAGGRGGLIVFIDQAKMGWVEALRDIPATQISSIQFMDAATATALLAGIGSEIVTGAIVVHQRFGK